MNKSWLLIIFAGLLEVLWAIGLKYSTNWITWSGTILLIGLSFVTLIQATKKVPVATAYAVFTGIGTAGTVSVEMILSDEPVHWAKILLILVLLIGVIGLKLITRESGQKAGEA